VKIFVLQWSGYKVTRYYLIEISDASNQLRGGSFHPRSHPSTPHHILQTMCPAFGNLAEKPTICTHIPYMTKPATFKRPSGEPPHAVRTLSEQGKHANNPRVSSKSQT
ncbi:unnamed protein product, partial [Ectocarpus sp. 12 AP-2014]